MQKYPTLTQTFVYREVQALRAAGLQIETFSTWRPAAGELSAEARPLVDDTYYLFPLRLPAFAAAQLRFLVTRPRAYLGTLGFCLRRDQQSLGRAVRAIGHFLQGVYLAAEVQRRGLGHLHAHFARNAATLALVVSRLTGISFSFTAHANDLFVAPTMLADKILAARFIVAISAYNRGVLDDTLPAPDTLAKIHVVHCGLDVRRFAPGVAGRAAANQPPLILSVGQLVEKKGLPYLVQACAQLEQRGYQFRCVIVGRGPQEAQLRQMIHAAGLADCVQLAGPVFQEQLAPYLAKAQVFVLPCVVARDGDRDGIPVSLMEAMAMELPAVSTQVSGIPELIAHEQTGLLVPPRDADALAEALARLLDDPALRRQLGQAARARVMEAFDLETNARMLLNLFQAALAPNGTATSLTTPAVA
jgi:glycosyltransferase involved in cell wall biosynthesis